MLLTGRNAIGVLLLGCLLTNAAETHWAFKSVQAVTIPPVTASARNPIDAFLRAGEVAEAEPVTLVRRAYLIALGLPPSPDEVRAYTNNYGKLVEHVLA